MSTRKTTMERIEAAKIEKAQMEAEIKRLMNLQKEEERKARNHRICQRGGLLEKLLPETITFTDAQIRAFFEKTLLTPFARRIITDVTAQDNGETDEKPVSADSQESAFPVKTPKSGVAASAAKATEAVAQAG